MKSPVIGVLAILLLALTLCQPASGGAGRRAGTSGASELLIPVGTRDIALAGSTTAFTSGVEALYWNPAGVARGVEGVDLYFSHMNYLADIGVEYGAVSANFGGLGVISLELKSLSVGDILVTTVDNPDGTGQTFNPQFLTFGLSYSRLLTDRISVGATMHVISERMAQVSSTGMAFDIGVMYRGLFRLDGLSLGVAVKNIGPQMRFQGPGLNTRAVSTELANRGSVMYVLDAASFELPSTVEIGLGYGLPVADGDRLQISSSFQNNNFSEDEYRVGAEYAFQNTVFVRGGYMFATPETEEREYLYGACFGVGFHYAIGTTQLTFDYAYRAVKYFEGNNIFSLKIGL